MDNSDAMPDPYLDELDVRLDAIELETRLKAVQREKQMRTLEPPQGIIDWAIRVSVVSPCRSKRGVVIWRENATPIDRSISAGYNRPPQGFACDGSLECKSNCSETALHAEEVALLTADLSVYDAEMLHVKTVNGLLVPSGGPSCVACSKKILFKGLRGMWLYHENGWRFYDATEFHALSLQSSEDAITGKDRKVKILLAVLDQYGTYLESGHEEDLNRFFLMRERALEKIK